MKKSCFRAVWWKKLTPDTQSRPIKRQPIWLPSGQSSKNTQTKVREISSPIWWQTHQEMRGNGLPRQNRQVLLREAVNLAGFGAIKSSHVSGKLPQSGTRRRMDRANPTRLPAQSNPALPVDLQRPAVAAKPCRRVGKAVYDKLMIWLVIIRPWHLLCIPHC